MDPFQAPKKAPTDLLVQQGPSCWLFVIEALATANSANLNLSTIPLRVAMFCYPDGDEVDHAMRQPGNTITSRRTMALTLMAQNIADMITTLQNWSAHSDTVMLPLAKLQAFGRRHSVSSLVWVDPTIGIVYVGDDEDPTTDGTIVIKLFQSVQKCATGLVQLAQTTGPYDNEAARMLSTGQQLVSHDQELTDVVLTLQHVDLPCYASVHKRYRRTGPMIVGNACDLTGLALNQLEDTAHALLIESFVAIGNAGDDGRVTFKDPNFGNVIFTVTLAQFRAMAGAHGMELRPFLAWGPKPSALVKVLI